ncbi:MAG: carboxypeptidase M32 [Actinomycetota bacterium]
MTTPVLDPSPLDDVLTRWADITSIGAAAAVLSWDQETKMPPKGQASRGAALSTLAGLHHERLTDPALAEALASAAGSELDEVAAAQIREAQREVTRASAIPGDLARRIAAHQSNALATWQRAKADDDFDAFAPALAETIALTKEQAAALVEAGIAERPYDALLDAYEPGSTEAELAPLLTALRDELAPLAKAAAASEVVVDESPTRGSFTDEQQEALGRTIAEAIGYDFEAGRLDASAHPFTTGFGPGDVRITWRPESDDFRPGLFGVMHEVGHAMYEQGLPTEWAGTPLGSAVSLGIHESQSRLWENQVGRSRAFWQWALPLLHEHLPTTSDVTVDQLFPALHTVTPSMTRVEADEATYNLHIVARFEIERRMIGEVIDVADLPELWNETYQELLGIRPSNDAEGVMQDIHWAMGGIGYFPTYTLGNLISAQLFDAASAALGGVEDQLAAGEFEPLLGWLRDNVHRHGRHLTAGEIVEQATGKPLSSDAFLSYLTANVADVYGI